MNVNEAVELANRLEVLITNNLTFNLTREYLINGIRFISNELREYAEELDADMYNELGHAHEKYQDALYNELRADADAYNARRNVSAGV
jgi:hypothetical protein